VTALGALADKTTAADVKKAGNAQLAVPYLFQNLFPSWFTRIAINLQLLGGIWILQTFPSLVAGPFTRWFHRYALLAGWLAGMIFGTIAAYKVATPTASHWAGSVDTIFGHTIYVGLSAIILNLAVSVVLTLVFRAARVPASADETLPHQYTADHVEGPALAPAGVALGQRGARRAGRARAGLTSPA
jgi:solute:Na+ symporter, SSS family